MTKQQEPVLPFNLNPKLEYREAQQVSSKITIRLDDDIQDASYYGNVIERMSELTENDVVEIVVNTDGGSLNGTLAIVNAIQNCQAEIFCNIEGSAYSGGSLIALACPNIGISPYATMMLHSASGVSGGKMSDHAAMFNFTHDWTTKVIKDSYEGFLTDKELQEMLDGKDFWLDADGILERLEQRAAYFDKKLKDEAKRIEKEQKEEEANALRSQVSVAKPKKVKKQTTPDTLESILSV